MTQLPKRTVYVRLAPDQPWTFGCVAHSAACAMIAINHVRSMGGQVKVAPYAGPVLASAAAEVTAR